MSKWLLWSGRATSLHQSTDKHKNATPTWPLTPHFASICYWNGTLLQIQLKEDQSKKGGNVSW